MLSGRRLRPVCGDWVAWQRPVDDSDGLVTKIDPRKTELARPSRRGDREVLAANLSQVIIVAAPRPPPDPFLVDRYLAAAEMMGTAACIAYNKTDLDPAALSMDLAEFEALGYPVLRVSARDNTGRTAASARGAHQHTRRALWRRQVFHHQRATARRGAAYGSLVSGERRRPPHHHCIGAPPAADRR